MDLYLEISRINQKREIFCDSYNDRPCVKFIRREREIIMLSQKKYNRSRKDICIIIIIRSYSSRLNVVSVIPGQTGFFLQRMNFRLCAPIIGNETFACI